MRKGVATLVMGVTFGIIGVFVYNRLRNEAKDVDADRLINDLDEQIRHLEALKLGKPTA